MQPYVIDLLPLGNIDYQPLVTLIGDAHAKLAFYNGLLSSIPNPQVMLSPLTNQEATLSSKIEGTQATAREVMEHDAGLIKEPLINLSFSVRSRLNSKKLFNHPKA